MSLNPYIDHNDIEIKALRVLEDYKIEKPVVDVAKIANGLGIEIKEIDMPKGYEDVAGFYDKNNKVIYIDKKDPPQRKLFSIAHELGHVFLGHKNAIVLFRIPKEETKYPLEESEANSFAAHLLMPNYMIDDYMNKYDLDKSDYKKLANIFGVPVSSMRYTLERLK
jgi:Zn-dependent peptidase ImmA (M78 family)